MKPIVKYVGPTTQLEIGKPTYVRPVDHPSDLVSNTTLARTSYVVKIDYDNPGRFETENTVYVPFE